MYLNVVVIPKMNNQINKIPKRKNRYEQLLYEILKTNQNEIVVIVELYNELLHKYFLCQNQVYVTYKEGNDLLLQYNFFLYSYYIEYVIDEMVLYNERSKLEKKYYFG
jgi:hypothetical protein